MNEPSIYQLKGRFKGLKISGFVLSTKPPAAEQNYVFQVNFCIAHCFFMKAAEVLVHFWLNGTFIH